MSKYLDKDGLAHLWERIQQLVATCGGGVSGTSRRVNVPSLSTRLHVQRMDCASSLHLTIGGSNSKTGTISFEIIGEKPVNYLYAVIENLYATTNFHLFEKLKGYMVRETATSIFVDLFFYSEEQVTIVGSEIMVQVLVFNEPTIPTTNICYIEGTCSSDDDGGGDIMK